MAHAPPWFALVLAVLLVLPGLGRAAARPWVVAFGATLALVLLLLALPPVAPAPAGTVRWNWGGHLLALLGLAWVARSLVRRAGVSWPEMGFTLAQRRGSLRPALTTTVVVLAVGAAWMGLGRSRGPPPSLPTWVFEATLPGLLEEPLFRGVLLALLDRAFVARRHFFGVSLGWSAAVVTLVFVALHGTDAGRLAAVLPAALLYLWLRARTGSLLLPVVVHNLWNLSVLAFHG
jgi:uncharacterized protein